MNTRRVHRIFSVFLVATILITGVSCTQDQDTTTQEDDPVKIGAVLPLTGDLSFFGGPERKVLQMAKKEVNAEGGINGSDVQLIIEDSKSTAKGGVNALQKLLREEPDVVITSLTIVSNATQSIFSDKKIPQVALSVHPTIAKRSKYTLRPYYGLEQEMKVLSEYISKKNHEKVGLLWVQVPEFEVAINKILKKELKKRGGGIVSSETYRIGDTGIRSQLTKVQNTNPDVIMAMDFGNMYESILKNAKTMGIHNKIIANIGFLTAPSIDESLINGIPFAGPEFVIGSDEKYESFSKRYEKQFEGKPTYDVIYTYDAFMMIMKSIKEGGRESEEFIQSFKSIEDYKGVSGLINVKSNGGVSVEIDMGVYRDGKIEPLNDSEKLNEIN